MQATNQNRIRNLRKSISEIISVLHSRLTFNEDYTGQEIKSSVKTKKNAFLRGKYLLGKLQNIETEDARNASADWYKETIESMISAAEEAMNSLSEVMRQDIDVKEKSASVNSALDAKQEAYDYMDEIFDGVLELQGVVRSIEDGEGVKLLDNKDFQVGFAEDHAYQGFYPEKNRKVQPGYNKDMDAVVISYDGTVGEIINCYGLRIALPKPPKKKGLPNYRKKKEQQYWERPKLPEGLKKENAHQYIDVIEEEFRRRDEGYWFMNNGEMEYITGPHYMLLTHYKADAESGSYFHFRKAHRDLFYFLEAAWVDQRSLGVILGKTRRTGATHVADAMELTKAISTRGGKFGLTSKKNIDAKRAFEKISWMFKDMPFFFKPLNTGEGFAKYLNFTTPSQKTTKHNQRQDNKYDTLETIVDYEATSEDSYDGSALRWYTSDETSKWSKDNILAHWSKVRKTLLSGGIIRGKAFLLSTVEGVTGEEIDSEHARNGDRFKHLFYESDLSKRNPDTGKTPSGLYKIFISSLDNFGGFIDKYGNCISTTPEKSIEGVNGETITIGVRQHLENEWAPYKKDPARLNDEMRKDPITEADMFRIASEDSMFDTLKIQDQIEYNDNFYLDNGHPDYIIGNFRYVDDNKEIVEFYETHNGRFQINWFPPEEMRNAITIRGGKVGPKYDYLGAFGIDPYSKHQTKYGGGSKGAIVGYLGEHPVEGIPQNQFFLVYLARPPYKDIFYEDAIMAMKYFSMQALIENNVGELPQTMHRRGLTRYSMRRPDTRKLTTDEAMYGGIPSTNTDLLITQAAYLEEHIVKYIGYADSDKYRNIGEIGLCPFNDLLSDWIKFDVSNRTKYDATVASCLAVYGAHKFTLKNAKKKKTNINAADFYVFE